jgi:putative spermidine/putrescine transport system ATP-binding protein
MSDHFLSLSGITKSYDGNHKALDAIDLHVRRGEFISLLGPSGSGKTTLLMLIAGFETLTSGDIVLNGSSIERLPPHARNIGVVFQNYALFPHMTVAENLRFPLRMRGVSKAQSKPKVARALETVGLVGMADRYPSQLSGGQQQRVALARTLVYEPDLVLLDEPLGALDKNLREQMQVEFKRIHRELGVTMIYVTHDQTEAMTMSDRIVVMSTGRIEQIGSPSDVYFRPKTQFVASFVGDSNILQGTVSGNDGVISVPGFGPVASARRDLNAGQQVSLLMRPEIFKLRKGAVDASPIQREVVLQDTVNYGDSILVFGTVDRTPVRIRVPGRDSIDLDAGARYSMEWNPENVHVIA